MLHNLKIRKSHFFGTTCIYIQLSDGTEIADLQGDTTYKYLGIEENDQIEQSQSEKKFMQNI